MKSHRVTDLMMNLTAYVIARVYLGHDVLVVGLYH
jgi:hypothetical protein